MKLYVDFPIAPLNCLPRVVANATGQNVEMVIADDKMKKSLTNNTGSFPVLETKEGSINEAIAISKYFCALAGDKMIGKTNVEKAQVDQWISFANTTLLPCATTVNQGIFGTEEMQQTVWNEASKNLKAHMKVLNTALEGKNWLVGKEASLADIVMIVYLMHNLQTVLDGGFRKAMKNVNAWAEACLALPAVINTFGKVQMCAKPLKPVCIQEVKVKKEVVVQVKKVKEEKPKDNVESLPPSPFNIYDFKTLFINNKEKATKGMDMFYEMLDWEGWSFWQFVYDKYGTEGSKLDHTNNLMFGFLSRAEHTNKYCFGRQGVFGEEGASTLDIKGVWLVRGQEIPDGLAKEHPQFEYYNTKKLDPRNNKDDDKMVRTYFSCNIGDMVDG